MDTNSKSFEIIQETPEPRGRLLYSWLLKTLAFFASVVSFLIGLAYFFILFVEKRFSMSMFWTAESFIRGHQGQISWEQWLLLREEGGRGLIIISAFWLLALVLLVYQTIAAGHVPGRRGIYRTWFDKVPLDFMSLAVLCYGLLCASSWDILNFAWQMPDLPALLILVFLALPVPLLLYLSCMKNIKNKTFCKNTLIYIVFSGCWKAVKNGARLMAEAAPVQWLAVGVTVFLGLFILYFGWLGVYAQGVTIIMGLALIGCAVYFLLLYTNHLTSLREKDLQEAIGTAVKAERLRSELITNVSHDLRTPLTSIVTYVDLLKTEGLTAPGAPKYLDIVEQKAQRLQHLTDDLLEASKAASGSMTVNWERVSLCALVNQAMGELSDRIAAAELDFRVSLPEPPPVIYADGRMMWRILENLFSNALKYSLPGTRVYITVENTPQSAVLTMKNISSNPLNIDPAELTERFARGDGARSTEGSGLGLSIVLSMTKLQNGVCDIQIDGDLFKVWLTFPSIGSTPTATPSAPSAGLSWAKRLFGTKDNLI